MEVRTSRDVRGSAEGLGGTILEREAAAEVAAEVAESRAYVHTVLLARSRQSLLNLLIERRKKLDMSQAKVAAAVGTQQSAISALEQGRKDPRLWTLLRIAESLNCYISFELVEFPEDPSIVISDLVPDVVGNPPSD